MAGTIGTVSAWKKVPVRVELYDGTVLQGVFVIARDNRLSDFLNNPKKIFIALMDNERVTHLLNKSHIVRATEIKP